MNYVINKENQNKIDEIKIIKTKRQEVEQISSYFRRRIDLTYDNGIVTATVVNKFEDFPLDLDLDVVFKFEGDVEIVKSTNGVATIEFEVVDSGEYLVVTDNEDADNGMVVING